MSLWIKIDKEDVSLSDDKKQLHVCISEYIDKIYKDYDGNTWLEIDLKDYLNGILYDPSLSSKV